MSKPLTFEEAYKKLGYEIPVVSSALRNNRGKMVNGILRQSGISTKIAIEYALDVSENPTGSFILLKRGESGSHFIDLCHKILMDLGLPNPQNGKLFYKRNLSRRRISDDPLIYCDHYDLNGNEQLPFYKFPKLPRKFIELKEEGKVLVLDRDGVLLYESTPQEFYENLEKQPCTLTNVETGKRHWGERGL